MRIKEWVDTLVWVLPDDRGPEARSAGKARQVVPVAPKFVDFAGSGTFGQCGITGTPCLIDAETALLVGPHHIPVKRNKSVTSHSPDR